MVATFDPMAGGPLAMILGALQAHLLRYFPTSQFTHGLVSAQLTPAVWAELTRRCPFIGLGWRGVQPAETSGRVLQGSTTWSVWLITRHEKVEARHTGDRLTPGLLAMVAVAQAALQGAMLLDAAGRPIGTVSVTAVDNLASDALSDANTAFAGITIAVPLPAPGPEALAGLDEFLRLGCHWDLPQLPAEDLIEVRTA